MERYTTIRELPPEERPREKLAHWGAASLREYELLAILLRTGTTQMSALQLAAAPAGTVRRRARRDARQRARAGAHQGHGAGKSHPNRRRDGTRQARRAQPVPRTPPNPLPRRCLPTDAHAAYRREARAFPRRAAGHQKPRAAHRDHLHRHAGQQSGASARGVSYRGARGRRQLDRRPQPPQRRPHPQPRRHRHHQRLKDAGELLGVPLLDHLILGDGNYTSLRERGYL
jgi:DNA repair protein RadC